MSNWEPKNPEFIDRVDRVLSPAPVYRKNMFGHAAWFLSSNRQMFAGAWGDRIMVRLGSEQTKTVIQNSQATQFDPMGGKPMREYALLVSDETESDEKLLEWLDEGISFTSSLPQK